MATYTYTIYDGDPSQSGQCQWDRTDCEVEADDDAEASEAVRDILEVEAAGLSRDDGYDPGDTLYAHVWGEGGRLVASPRYTISDEDLA